MTDKSYFTPGKLYEIVNPFYLNGVFFNTNQIVMIIKCNRKDFRDNEVCFLANKRLYTMSCDQFARNYYFKIM